MHKFVFLGVWILGLLAGTDALAENSPKKTEAPPEEELTPEAPTTKQALEENMRLLVRGSNIVGFELYDSLRGTSGNLCFSPYSIASALAIPYAGVKSASQEQMRTVMRFLSQPRQVNEVFAGLNKFYTTAWFLGSNECRLFFGNALWIQRDFAPLKNYTDLVNSAFPQGVKYVDFNRNSEGARYNMNTWIREKTQGRITEEIQKEDVAGQPPMILASSAFFKGVWHHPFNPALTKEGPFFLDAKTTTSAKMMSLSGKFKVFKNNDMAMIELPYRGGFKGTPELAMVIILPSANFGLASIEEKFYNDNWVGWLAGMREEACIVTIPKFTIQQTFDIGALLARSGMQTLFTEQADFSGISAKSGLYLKRVIHGAYLSIDEKGSDAISANPLAVSDATAGLPEGAVIFKADHPFIYVVMDRIQGTILYLGRYKAPEQMKANP